MNIIQDSGDPLGKGRGVTTWMTSRAGWVPRSLFIIYIHSTGYIVYVYQTVIKGLFILYENLLREI